MKFEPLTRFARGFVYAYNGIRAAIREERNFRFHLCAAFYAFLAAFWAELAPVEVALVAVCVAAVLALELVNSAIERAVDKPDTTHWWTAGAAKDMAAGAVLVMALGTLVVAVCLLVPHFGTLWANLYPAAHTPGGHCADAGHLYKIYFPFFQLNRERQTTEWQNRFLKCPPAYLWRWSAAPMWANPA